MGKKRSNRSSSRGSNATSSSTMSGSGGNTSNTAYSGSSGGGGGSFHPLPNQTFSHPTGVPINTNINLSGGIPPPFHHHSSSSISNTNNSSSGGGGGGNNINNGSYPFTPAMIRELLSASATGGGTVSTTINPNATPTAATGGYSHVYHTNNTTPSNDLNQSPTNMAHASNSTTAGGGGGGGASSMKQQGGQPGGGNSNSGLPANFSTNNNMGNMSPEDAVTAQRYLQSISQALASQLTATQGVSGSGASSGGITTSNTSSGGTNATTSGNNNKPSFGPIPPPPPQSMNMNKGGVSVTMGTGGSGSVTISSGSGPHGASATFDLDASSMAALSGAAAAASAGGGGGGGSLTSSSLSNNNAASISMQLEALSAIMAQQQQGGGEGGGLGGITISTSAGMTSGKHQQQQQQQQRSNFSAASNSGGGGTMTNAQIAALMAQMSGTSMSSSASGSTTMNNPPNNNNNNTEAQLDALEKMRLETVNHMSNFQQLLNAIASQGSASKIDVTFGSSTASGGASGSSGKSAMKSGGSGSNSMTTSTTTGGSSGNNNTNNNNNSNNPTTQQELQSMLPIFSELVSLTNTIVAAQEAGDTEQVDAVTTQLCERVMKDSQAMGVLSVAMNNPVGIAGMNAVFQGMMSVDNGGGGSGTGGNGSSGANVSSVSSSSSTGGKNSHSHSHTHSRTTSSTTGGGMMGSMGSVSMSMGSMGSGGNSYSNMGNVKKMNREEGEALRRAAAMSGGGGSKRQPHGHQNQYSGGGSSSNSNNKGSSSTSSSSSPVFSMIFGGNNSGGPMPPGVSVPPLPPPPGGWPPGAAPAAAAAAAMAAFASSFNTNDPNNRGPDGNFQMPNMNMAGMGGGGSNGQMPPDFGSAAWLDYYDACLRAGGLKGGIAEFEEYARMNGQPGIIPPGGGGGSSTTSSSGGGSHHHHHHHHRSMPQDRPIPRMGKEQDDDVVPAQFEYDDGTTNNGNDSTTPQQQMSEQELQELAIEEEEKKKKKAAKKRDKKARQKERAKKEAEAKAALAAMKKREKAIASWRSRIVQACGNEDGRKMEVLVGESPYKNYTYDPTEILPEEEEEEEDHPHSHEDYLMKHMDWFLANCLQKYQNIEFRIPQEQPFPNNSARECLAKLVLSTSSNVVLLQGPGVKSRNAIHSAAYRNDADFIKWVIETCCGNNESDKKQYLESLCEDAGWAPLHYAIAGGSEDVVELLLANGCAVQTRTDRDLTCFNRRRGNGITARELAVVLQSGAVDDDLTSNADILDEVVDDRIDHVSADEKSAYMRILKTLEERLAYTEARGFYSPPPKTVEEQQSAAAATLQASVNDTQSTAVASSMSKKSKKKKKKQQQQQTSTTAKAPALASAEPESKSAASDEDLTDPVAVALLGMGFTEDQIKSAARALGGFERATADDMVMWILGGGEIADGGSAEPATIQDHVNAAYSNDGTTASSDAAVLTKAQKKSAARAKREAEEAAQKHQEEIAAGQRAAAKREEQRRIRREWNEREQARQEEEKATKFAEAMERRRMAEMEKLLPNAGVLPPGVVGAVPTAVHVPPAGGGGGKHHGGPPLTIIAGGQKMPSGNKSKSAGSNMGIPQAPTVRAPKILTRPSNAPPGTLPSGAAGGVHPHQQQSVAGSQPLFATQPAAGARHVLSAASPPRGHAKQYNPNAGHHRNPQPVAILQKNNNVTSGPHVNRTHQVHTTTPAPEYHHPGQHVYSASAPHMGSNTAPMFQAQMAGMSGAVVPPGFQSGGIAPEPVSASPIETNPMGMIRASAREFVPTSFVPQSSAPAPPKESSMGVPSMSAQSTVPATVSPPPPTRSTSNDNSATASANLLVEPMSSLLSSFGAESNTPPATLVSTTGNKDIGDSTVPSAASSITGFSGLPTTTGEENIASRVGSVMTFESTSAGAGGIQTPSILESITYGAGDNQNTIGSGAGLGSGADIWGGSNNVNQSTSTSLGLAGLNFSSFMGGGTGSDSQNNDNNAANLGGGGSTWGTNAGGGGGSIW